jgi:hypothetical protein
MRGALISSVVEEYNLAFCYPGIFHMSNFCGFARDFFVFFCLPCKRNKKSPRLKALEASGSYRKSLL